MSVEKVDQITQEERDYVGAELVSLAGWLRNKHKNMHLREINRFLHEMLNVSV